MKNLLDMKKLLEMITVVIIILIILVINFIFADSVFFSYAEEAQIEEENTKAKAIIQIDLEKYVNYNLQEENKGVLLQMNVKTGIEYEDTIEYHAIKKTGIIIDLPKINDEYPENVELIAKSTKATNGSESGKDINYKYNLETGKIAIIIDNKEDENKNIYTENIKDARDEIKLNCYYSEKCYTQNKETRNIELVGTVKEKINDGKDTIITGETIEEKEVKEDISSLNSVNKKTSNIYDGYIKANYKNGTSYNTKYTEKIELNFDYKGISDEIEFIESEKFVNTKNEEKDTNEIVYESTKINKNEVLDILGEDGNLQIQNEQGQVLLQVNKDTETEEDGTIKIDYEDEITKLIIKTSVPEKVGNINLLNYKYIKESMQDLENRKIKTSIKSSCINNIVKKDEETNEIISEYKETIYSNEDICEVEIKESETKAKLSIDKQEWTNKTQNDVNFTVTLLSNNNKYNLFTNPVIEIELPKEVEKVFLGNKALLNDNSLVIASTQVIEKEENKIIRIELDGEQSSYSSNEIYEGAEILISATVILRKDIVSKDTNINMTYCNENEEKHSESVGIKINSTTKQNPSVNTVSVGLTSAEENNELLVEISAQVGNKTLENNDTIHEKEIVKYIIKIANNSDQVVSGINVLGEIPEGACYVTVSKGTGDDFDTLYEYVKDESVTEYTNTIDTLEAGKEITLFYEVKINELSEGENEKAVQNNIKVQDASNQIISQYNITHIIEKAELEVKLKSDNSNSDMNQNIWQYYLEINNISGRDLQNIDVYFNIPKYLKVINVFLLVGEQNLTVDEINSENILPVNLDTLASEEKIIIEVYTEGCDYEPNNYEYEIVMTAKISGESINTYYSNENRQTMYVEGVEIIQSSDKEGKEIKCDEEIEYGVIIKNVGNNRKQTETNVNVLDYLPTELVPISAEYETYSYNEDTEEYEKTVETTDLTTKEIVEGEETEATPDLNLYITIPMGEEINIKIKAKSDIVYERTEISNTVIVKGDNIITKTSNVVKTTILPYKDDSENTDGDTDDSGNNSGDTDGSGNNSGNTDGSGNNSGNTDNSGSDSSDLQKKYNISGLVWIDENKDGKRDEGEELVSGITVKLYNADTNHIVKDENQKNKVETTEEDGTYSFSNINKGNYLVLFEYDTRTYNLTNYKASGVNEKRNSDVIFKTVSIDGNEKDVGVTDVLQIAGNKLENIDMGLIKNQKLDFSLKKYINKVIVSNNEGTKEITYNNSQLAKVEISKKQIENTTISIEYKIVVTNEGEAPGVINEILDYLPEGLTFSKQTNKNWTQNANGNLSTTAFAGLEIKPGESKEIPLVVTKTINSEDIGIITNTAEIGEIYNSSNLNDIDSVAENKNKDEDDYSEASLIISIKTGIIAYTIGIFVILAILILILLLVNKKKIKLKKIMPIFMIIIVMVGISWGNTSQAYSEAGAKAWVKSKYPDPGNRKINYNSGFATHNSKKSVYVNEDKLHCTDGTLSMCGTGVHYYKRTGQNVSIKSHKTLSTSSNTYTTNSNAKMVKLDETYNLAGPYKITKSGNCTCSISVKTIKGTSGDITDYKITDSTGKEITPSIDTDFYIKVPSSITKIEKVTVDILTRGVGEEYTVKYKYVETWKCYKVSGSHTHACRDHKKAQPTERVYEKSGKYSEKKDTTTTKEFGAVEIEAGGLTLTKVDSENNNIKLSGAVFTFYNETRGIWLRNWTGGTEFTTDVNGTIALQDIYPGTYKIYEIKAPDKYDILTSETTAVVDPGNTASVTVTNAIKPGRLILTKVDKENNNIRLSGAVFKFYNETKGEWIQNWAGGTEFTTDVNGTIDLQNIKAGTYKIYETRAPDKYDISTSETTAIVEPGNTASVTVTNAIKPGRIILTKTDETNTNIKLAGVGFKFYNQTKGEWLQNLGWTIGYTRDANSATEFTTNNNGQIDLQNIKAGTYKIYETKGPDKYEITSQQTTSILGPGDTKYVTITNKRKYIDITGYVWENQETIKKAYVNPDEIYTGSNDKKMQNIKVRLKNKSGSTVKETTTNSSGNYTFSNVDIDDLPNLYIEFEYNGMVYQDVTANTSVNNGSKASEGTNRDAFNKKFAQIIPNKAVSTSGSQKTLTYNQTQNTTAGKKEQKSTINYGTDSYYLITANTRNAYNKYLGEIYTPDYIRKNQLTSITNINLGLRKREQPDIAVVNDLYSANVHIANEDQLFKYRDRNNRTNLANIKNNNVNPTVQWGLLDAQVSYTRPLYASDIYTLRNPNTTSDPLKLTVIYEVKLINQSTTLKTTVKGITNYFDAKYTFIGASLKEPTNGKINANNYILKAQNASIRKEVGNAKQYNQITEIPLNVNIEANQEKSVYLEFAVNSNSLVKLLDSSTSAIKLDNIVEITKYETKAGKYTRRATENSIYAGIDKDSAPGNFDINHADEQQYYEDDTNRAPGLKLILQEERTTSGKVFLDNDGNGDTIKTGKIRQGNGILDNGERGIEGVKVSLRNQNGTIAKYYDYNDRSTDENAKWKDAICTTNANGEYKIGGYIPGTYYIAYEWGGQKVDGKTITVQNYKSTIVNKEVYTKKGANLEWYKDTFKQTNKDNSYTPGEWNTSTNKENRISDALDSYTERETIDNQTSTLTYKKVQDINNAYNSGSTDGGIITKMTSTTNKFKVGIEYDSGIVENPQNQYELNTDGSVKMNGKFAVKKEQYKNAIKSIDFGIVERAKQQIELNKYISNVKVTLTTGLEIINVNIDENGTVEGEQNVKYIQSMGESNSISRKQLKLEIDDELVQNATLRLQYKLKAINKSEVEYKTKEYYYYGKISTNENDIVKIMATKVIDYIDDDISIVIQDINNEGWTIIEKNKRASYYDTNNAEYNGLLTSNIKEIIQNTTNVAINEKFTGQQLLPQGNGITGNNQTSEITFESSKLLATSQEGTEIENDAEIIEVQKTGGALLNSIPGNFVSTGGLSVENRESDDSSVDLIVVPPTGNGVNYIAYTILAITSLGLIMCGIVLIKKYALK